MNSRQSGRHIADEAKDKKEGSGGGKEGAANVKTCALLFNNIANGPVVMNQDKKEKKMQKKEAAVTLHNKDRPPRM